MTAAELHNELHRLRSERFAAIAAGLGENVLYMGDLDAELAACTEAYVGTAVTEIATLHAELSGRPQG